MAKMLITGGAGFIGSHIAEALLSKGHEVRIVDNLLSGSIKNINSFADKIEFIQGDILYEKVLSAAMDGVDVVFHHAAIPSVALSVKQPISNHVSGGHLTILALEAAVKAGVKRFIYAGSSSAYGDAPGVKTEESALSPISPYAASKLSGEHYVSVYAKCYDIDTVIFRYFNVFGPRQDPSSEYSGVLARFCKAYSTDQDITIFGDGEQSRDFVFVKDVAQANVLASEFQGELGGSVINIGSGETRSLNEIVYFLNSLEYGVKTPIYKPARTGDVKHTSADIGKARRILGYCPRTIFRDGIDGTMKSFKCTGV